MPVVDREVQKKQGNDMNEKSLLDAPIDERMKSFPENLIPKVIPTSRAMIKRQLMKQGRFHGTGSLESFLKQFEVCANHNQWPESEKTDFLECTLDK